MAGKRKRLVVTIEKKIEAIHRVEKGESLRKISEEFNVGTSTVSDWLKTKEKLLQHASKSSGSMHQPKIMKKSTYPVLDEALFLWFVQARENGTPISGPLIKEKASSLAKTLGPQYIGFKASEGWLSRWKNRHGVKQFVISEEKMATDSHDPLEYANDFSEIIQNYTKNQIFIADATGLYYKMIPAKSLKTETTYKCNERNTVMFCYNASADFRLPLVFIGKSKNPRALQNLNSDALPVFYRNEKTAWLSKELFSEWFQEEFVPEVLSYLDSKNLPHKAILLLDESPSHPNLEKLQHGEIITKFFPSNITSLRQPKHKVVIECFKRNYRKLMLETILGDDTNDSIERLKLINIKDVIYWSAQSWDSVEISTLQKCWNKLSNENKETSDDIVDSGLSATVKGINGCENDTELEDWMTCEIKQELTDDEIIDLVIGEEEEPDGDDSTTIKEERISSEEGFHALDVALKFVEQHQKSTPTDVMLIRHWRDIAARERLSKQT